MEPEKSAKSHEKLRVRLLRYVGYQLKKTATKITVAIPIMGVLFVFMKKIGTDLLDRALALLAETIEFGGYPPQHFVVCGGSSLLALELVSRTATRDVDVLARLEDRKLVQAKPLPDWLMLAAESVRNELDLPQNWFNAGPADDSFFRWGFPEGIEARLIEKQYGDHLAISFISRYDQIFFKLYASADSGPGRHYTDLRELQPTRDELLAAARWTRIQDPSEGFEMVLGQLLKELGHADLADEI